MDMDLRNLTITPEILKLIAEIDEFKGGWRAGIAKHDQHRLSNGEEAHPRSGRFPLPHDPAHLHDEPAGQRRSAEGRAGAAGPLGHHHDDGHLRPRDTGDEAHLSAVDGQGSRRELVSVRKKPSLVFPDKGRNKGKHPSFSR